MFRLDIWRKHDPCSGDVDVEEDGRGEDGRRRPDETYWFTDEDLRATFIEHVNASATDLAPDDEGVSYLHWEKSFDEAGPAAPVVNPTPPPAAHLYTAIWRVETGKTVVTKQLISLQRKEREPEVSAPQLSPTDPGLPITTIRWGARVAGQCHKIMVFGTDRERVESTLAAVVQSAIADGKVTSVEDLSAMAAESATEQATYFQPIHDQEAKLLYAQNAPNFFGVMGLAIAEARSELFKVRAELRPKYEAALALARGEAGLPPVAISRAELPSIFLDEAERWIAATETMFFSVPPPPAAAPGLNVAQSVGIPQFGPMSPPQMAPGLNSAQSVGVPQFGTSFGPSMAGMLGSGMGNGPIRPPMPPTAGGPLSQAATAAAPTPTVGVPAAGMGVAGFSGANAVFGPTASSPGVHEAYVTTPPIRYAAAVADKLEKRAGALNQEARTWLVDAVRAERAQGRSWDSIAADLGVSRQAAHTRFAKAIGEENV